MIIFSLGATWINALLNTIWLSICQVIYIFINWLYQVFDTVANVNLFSEEVFRDITSRIYIVMGIAMLFIFAYNVILMIINPDDKKSTGSTTKLVKETIISLVVIVLLPTIFNYMYVFQGHVLSSNIIGQIIMGGIGSTSGNTSNCDPDDYECSCDFSKFEELKSYGTGVDKNILAGGFTEGNTDVYQSLVDACKRYKNDLTDSQRGAYSIAPTIFSAFYRPANYNMIECEEYLKTGSSNKIDTDQKKQICANFFFDIKMSKYTGNVNAFVYDSYLMLTMSTDDGLIEFDWLFAIIAGGLAVWMFLCYAMEIGVRVAKLGVLQIISPIAVMMRVVPSKGGGENQMYTKWFDELKNTYLDVFIRLVIIFFALFAISLVPDVVSTLFSSVYAGNTNWFIETLSLVIVILGILKFAQEAPELLKTFFGSGGKFSLRSPKKQFNDNKIAKGAIGGFGAFSATTGKSALNAGKFFKAAGNDFDNAKGAKAKAKSLWNSTKGAVGGFGRYVGQGIGSAVGGYKYGKDAKDWDEIREGTYKAAREQLSKPTLGQKIKGMYQNEKDDFTGFYGGQYKPYNSPAELKKAQKLEEVAKKQEAFEALLDNTDFVKAINSTFEGAIKRAQDSGATAEEIKKIYDDWKVEKSRARAEAFKEKGSDLDIKAALDDYRDIVKENIGIVKDSLKENGKTIDIELALSDERLKTGEGYTDARDIGGSSKKSAIYIRQQAIEQQKNSGGK